MGLGIVVIGKVVWCCKAILIRGYVGWEESLPLYMMNRLFKVKCIIPLRYDI